MAITAANLQVEVGASTRGAEAGLARVERRMGRTRDRLNGLGKSMRRTGGRMTKMFTLPMAAGAGAAVKMAADFETGMTKIEGLVGASEEQVESYKKAILGMAGDVAKSPQELADALFFITSAGLEGQEALDALRMSAMGSAAGLGETEQVANAVTNALNAYAEGALDAEQATDVLTATVREGKAEASELGPQFGRVLPFASELGVTFDQVGGALAFFTKSTGDASKAGTFLEGILRGLVKPTKQGEEALAGIGMTFDDVRASIAEDGLLATLRELRGEFGEDTDAMSKLFSDSNALAGVLQMTGDQAEDAAEIMNGVADSTGATRKAFDQVSDTVAFKFKQAVEDAKASLITLGSQLLPTVSSALESLSGWIESAANWWGNLSPGMQKAVLIFAGLVAAAGPLLLILGGLVSLIAALISPVGLVVVGIGALVGTIIWAYNESETFRDVVQSVLEGIQRFWATWGETIMRVVKEVWAAVKKIFFGALEAIGGYVKLFVSLFTGDWQGMKDAAEQISRGMLKVLSGIFNALFGVLRGIVSSIRTMLVSIWQDAWQAMRRTASTQAANLIAFFAGLPGRIVSAMGSVNRILVEVGKNLIRGLIRGVKDLAGEVADAVTGAIGDAVGAGKRLLGISSPSKLMAGIGEDMNEGLLRGLRSDSERVHRQMLSTMQVPTVQRMAGGQSVSNDNRTHREGDTIIVNNPEPRSAESDLARANRRRAYLAGE